MSIRHALTTKVRRDRRQRRTRASLRSTVQRARLAVHRSNRFISAQIIDDAKSLTIVAAHERELSEKSGTPIERARAVGKLLAERAKAKDITKVVFDRRSYRYHGRVRALAEAARDHGLTF